MSKKFKLISAICVLSFSLSLLIFAVWSAVTMINFDLGASLSFDPNSCYVEINGGVSGDGINNISNFKYISDTENANPEWSIGNLFLLNQIEINLEFKNFSNFPVKITVSGVESGDNYNAVLSQNEIVLNSYVLNEVADSQTLTITYQLINQNESINLEDISIKISIEETEILSVVTFEYSEGNGYLILNDESGYYDILDSSFKIQANGTISAPSCYIESYYAGESSYDLDIVGWENAQGERIEFPYTPTTNETLYAVRQPLIYATGEFYSSNSESSVCVKEFSELPSELYVGFETMGSFQEDIVPIEYWTTADGEKIDINAFEIEEDLYIWANRAPILTYYSGDGFTDVPFGSVSQSNWYSEQVTKPSYVLYFSNNGETFSVPIEYWTYNGQKIEDVDSFALSITEDTTIYAVREFVVECFAGYINDGSFQDEAYFSGNGEFENSGIGYSLDYKYVYYSFAEEEQIYIPDPTTAYTVSNGGTFNKWQETVPSIATEDIYLTATWYKD